MVREAEKAISASSAPTASACNATNLAVLHAPEGQEERAISPSWGNPGGHHIELCAMAQPAISGSQSRLYGKQIDCGGEDYWRTWRRRLDPPDRLLGRRHQKCQRSPQNAQETTAENPCFSSRRMKEHGSKRRQHHGGLPVTTQSVRAVRQHGGLLHVNDFEQR
jgi:hypothetical protein